MKISETRTKLKLRALPSPPHQAFQVEARESTCGFNECLQRSENQFWYAFTLSRSISRYPGHHFIKVLPWQVQYFIHKASCPWQSHFPIHPSQSQQRPHLALCQQV